MNPFAYALIALGMFAAAISGTPPVQAQTGLANWETPHVTPIALTPSGDLLLAVNTPDNRLEIFDLSGGGHSPAWIRSVPVGLDPASVRARSDTEAWVVNHVSDSISIVDLPTGRVVRTILTADEPADVVFAGSPARAFVSISQRNQLHVYDPANLGAPPQIISIQGEDPRALAVSPDGSRVYAAIFESTNPTTAVRQQDVSNPAGPYAGVNPPPNSGNLFNPARNPANPPAPPVAQIVRRDAAGAWRDDNGRIWSQFVTWNLLDHDVAIIDATALTVTYADGMLTTVMALGVKPDGTVTAVGTEAANQIRFEPNVQSTFIRSLLGSFDPISPAATSITDLNPHLTYAVRSLPPPQRVQSIGDPRGIVWNASGDRGYIAGMGSNNVAVIDGAGARVGLINVAGAGGPTGLALNAAGSRLYVLNKFAGSISAVDTATRIEIARTPFFDPTPAAIKLGRPFLYDTHAGSGLGQASCASCHIDGRTDFLAWDLGNPAGAIKAFDQDCRQPACQDWHPMKGPMVTQTLQGISGNEPFHWRGDRSSLGQFAPAFVGLQGADEEPAPSEMQLFSDFVATIQFPSSPNQNFDSSFPPAVPTTGGTTGNPSNGLNLYLTLPVLPGGARCVTCHALPDGTSLQIDDPRLPLAPQPLKMAQLRGMWEKTGWRRNSQASNRGFGFTHHSEFDTLFALLNAGFNFALGPAGQQQRHDVEAFLLCFETGTHAGVGQQVTFDGTNNDDAAPVARLNSMVTLAQSGVVGLVAKGQLAGVPRGWTYTAGLMQSDLAGQLRTPTSLRSQSTAGGEVTFTLVPIGTQVRIGIDRDADTYFDRDESLAGSDPADPTSTPLNVCRADFNDDDIVNSQDFFDFLAAFFSGGPPADFNADGTVNSQDFFDFLGAFFIGCP